MSTNFALLLVPLCSALRLISSAMNARREAMAEVSAIYSQCSNVVGVIDWY